MPEGHLIHFYAREHGQGLRGHVRATSPQGRFETEATALDGGRIVDVEAYGKHLFYRWEHGAVVHVHLGLRGVLLSHPPPAPQPRGQVRLRLAGQRLAVDLIAPARCDLLDAGGREQIVARLGEDPLRADADPDVAWERLRRSSRSLGVVLLDQSVIAGVGNVLRAEVLNIARLHPARPANTLTKADFDRLWELVRHVMVRAAERGRIVTVDPPPETDDRALPDAELRFVYKREHCARCGTAVRRWELGARDMHACERCQPPFAG